MRGSVLDASALLALLNNEPGNEQVARVVTEGAVMSSVNLSEVVTKFSEAGMPEVIIHEILDPLSLIVINFDKASAYQAGLLRPLTKHAGLSFGDRACLALAMHLNLPVLTADRAWENVLSDVKVHVIR